MSWVTCRVTTGVCPVGRDTALLSPGIHTHQSLHAHLHPALLQASHTSQTIFSASFIACTSQVTPNRGTYLLPAPLELKGQWDKALRTGQSWSFFPHKVRRTAPLLLLPAPSACTVAPGITQAPSGLGHGGFRVHDTAPALRVPSMRTTAGTRFIRGSWHKGRQMPSGGHLLRWSGNAGWQGMKML